MPRLSVPLNNQQHRAIKAKAADMGVAMAEAARRLLLQWVIEDTGLPQGNEYRALRDAAVSYYAERADG